MKRYLTRLGCVAVTLGLSSMPSTSTLAHQAAFLDTLSLPPAISLSTIPENGDTNPYGVAIVRDGFEGSKLVHRGDILVSNFNDAAGDQGTGTTIVAVDPKTSDTSTFFTADPSEEGLTTALLALSSGLVVVGNAQRIEATATAPATVDIGSLTFLDRDGNVVSTLMDNRLLRGPWDMTADESDPDDPILYVSNVLDGTVTRIDLHVHGGGYGPVPEIHSLTRVASGFGFTTNPAALVLGPTGVLLSHDGRDLYVADTANNRIQLVKDVRDARRSRGAGETIVSGSVPGSPSNGSPLNGPLGLAWTPRDTIVLSNGDALTLCPPPPVNLLIEFDPHNGNILATLQPDTSGTPGGLFGIVIGRVLGKTSLVYVDDNSNSVNVLPQQ
jgi:hypothetical protein